MIPCSDWMSACAKITKFLKALIKNDQSSSPALEDEASCLAALWWQDMAGGMLLLLSYLGEQRGGWRKSDLFLGFQPMPAHRWFFKGIIL